MSDHWVQCLLFLVQEEHISDASPIERSKIAVYALVPHIQHYDHICQVFSQSGITVLRDQTLDSSLTEGIQSNRVEVMEILLEKELVGQSKFVVCAEYLNKNLLEMIFSGRHTVRVGSCDLRTLRESNYDSVLDKENLAVLEKLLTFGSNIRYRHEEGGFFLHFAIEKNSEPLIRLLLKNGAQVNAKMSNDHTALHLVVEYNLPVHILDLLIQHGGNVNATTVVPYRGGATPLHLALRACYDNLPIVQHLLDNGASVEADSSIGNILQTAELATEEKLACVLSHGPDLNNVKNQEAFRSTVKYFKRDIVRMLEEYGFKLTPDDARDMDMLLGAIGMGRVDLLKDLLKWGAGHNYRSTKTKDQADDIVEDLLVKVMHQIKWTQWTAKSFEFLLELADFRLRVFNLLVESYSVWWNNLALIKHALDSSDLCLGLNFDDIFFHTLEENIEIGRKGALDVIRRHFEAVTAAHLTVNETVSNWRENELVALLPAASSASQEECEMQVAMMEVETVGDSDVTFHDILNRSVEEMVSFLKNDAVVEVLKAKAHKSFFPAYSEMIHWRFRKAHYRRTLVDQGIKMFDFLFKNCPHKLPYELREKIINYCSNLDLLVFVSVCKIPTSKSEDA